MPPVKEAHQGGIQAGDVGVGKAGRTAPDADDHLFDELRRCVAPVGAWWGQIPALQRCLEVQSIEHAFQKSQTTLGGDFTGGEFEVKGLRSRHDDPQK